MAVPNIKYHPLLAFSLTATEALEPYRIVKLDGKYCDEDEQMIGVTEIPVDDDTLFNAICSGTCIVETSESVVAGEWVSSDDDGKAKVVDAREPHLGIALSSCSGAGFIEVLIYMHPDWTHTHAPL